MEVDKGEAPGTSQPTLAWFRSPTPGTPEAALASAARGDPEAALALGCCYADGCGVPRDRVEALKWFSLAVLWLAGSATPAEAAVRRRRDQLWRDMTEPQIAQALWRARAAARQVRRRG